ncbi:granulocyte-macrophage colony-stimulating factor receptor subunit alpha [Columba livia]|nr:granulocyte-macrophage colony-stimulating factor receptor subunit alpha [Columba livia]
MNGTAIENFVCVIFNVSFMNCTWHVGRTASGDTQYFLYWKNSKKENFTGCQNYIKDNHGRHTGCRFQNVTIENKRAHFLVNGSKSGQNIQTYEKMIFLYEIENKADPNKNIKTTSKMERNVTGNSYIFESFSAEKRKRTTYICFIIYLIRDTSAGSKSRTFSLHSIEYKNILIKDEPEDIITVIEEVA